MPLASRPCRNQRGNVLFLILLAVILFAALSYAVTSSLRGGGKDASKESLQSQVAHLQNVQMQARSALQRMMLVGGLERWQIDWTLGGQTTAPGTNASCTSASCVLHDVNGGGFKGYVLPQKFWQDVTGCPTIATVAGQYGFMAISNKDIGIDNNRDVTLVYTCVSDALCKAVNDANGVANPGGAVPANTPAAGSQANGTYTGTLTSASGILTDTGTATRFGTSPADIAGKQMFCAHVIAAGTDNWIIMVLIER